jgi:hypothetical protein
VKIRTHSLSVGGKAVPDQVGQYKRRFAIQKRLLTYIFLPEKCLFRWKNGRLWVFQKHVPEFEHFCILYRKLIARTGKPGS